MGQLQPARAIWRQSNALSLEFEGAPTSNTPDAANAVNAGLVSTRRG